MEKRIAIIVVQHVPSSFLQSVSLFGVHTPHSGHDKSSNTPEFQTS